MNRSHLIKAASLFTREPTGCVLHGQLSSLYGAVHTAAAISNYAGGQPTKVLRRLSCIVNDFWVLATLVGRLAWMQRLADADQSIGEKWANYASADIAHWHIEFRSLLDYAAHIISELADRKNQVPESFSDLVKRALGDSSRTDFEMRLGADWHRLLRSAAWYSQIVSIRDQLIHFGAEALVFSGPKDGILFQVLRVDGKRLVNEAPFLMFNPNVVYFDRYSAHFTSHLLVFLDEFASIAIKRMGLHTGMPASMHHFGFSTLLGWIEAALAASQEVNDPKPTSG